MSVTVKEENLKEIELRLELEPVMRGELQTAQYVQIGHKEPVEGVRRFVPTRLFGVLVLLPLIGGFIYNFMIASDRYESVASFVVRETKNSGDLVSMLQGGGLTRSDDNSFAVTEYIRSRDAVAAINRDGFVTQVFAGDGLDPISRFPNFINGQSGEDLFEHFQRYVDVTFDTATGITTLSVQAFTPEQAQELARRLVKASEELVNGLNGRAQSDSTRFAEKLAVDSQAAMLDIQKEITAFRNENRILNADAEVTVSSGLIAGVLEALTRVNTEIAQQIASAPGSPRMTDLMLKRDALVEQLEKLRNEMVSGDGSIAHKLERFETLAIRQKIAQSNLISAETTLMKARQDAATEKLYLDNVVAPNLPDKVTYPEAYKNMLLILFISLSVFNIIRSLRDLIMEEN